jgi:hypothetical protein
MKSSGDLGSPVEAGTCCIFDSFVPSNPSELRDVELKFFRDISDRGRDSDRGFFDGDLASFVVSGAGAGARPRDILFFDGDLLSIRASSFPLRVVDLPRPDLGLPNCQKDGLPASWTSCGIFSVEPCLINSILTLLSSARRLCLVCSGMFRFDFVLD